MPDSEATAAHGQATPWAHFFAVIILGLWLITSPSALNYGSTKLTWSDVLSGLLVIGFAGVTLVRKSAWAPWASAVVGMWLLFAPLVFKAPTAAAYTNDTLAGALVIAFVLLMPGMPGMSMVPGPDAPPGWSYNPSTWPQRAPIIALALVGFFLSRQMAAYELGYTRIVWEPFFDPGTRAVLGSKVSHSFPISDAGLGAVAYMLEALMGFMGDKARWRTMPWMVSFFGILVVPLGIASVSLIILQPVSVGAWCTPCLLAALAMLIMIALTLDEVVAMGLFLAQVRREGQSLWRAFWMGGTVADTGPKVGAVRPDVLSAPAMAWGTTLPWNLLASAALGAWLMSSPTVFGSLGLGAHSDHVIGALVVTVSIVAMSEVGRAARFVNVAFGAWFIASPWLLSGATTAAVWNDVAVGIALILLSVRRGPVKERYGRWQRFIR
ncbi:MAG: SPW repeat protein [Acidimicrobiales bacterium]|nr:SPW repeat protein [Acidimicrobiales bacterium]